MSTIRVDTNFDHLQDVLGAMPMLRSYIPLCLCFHIKDNIIRAEIEHALISALAVLAEAFPFLTGRVILEGIKDGCSGLPKILPHGTTIPFIVKDLTRVASVPTSSKLRENNYPLLALDPTLLVPPIVRDTYPVDSSVVAPVFLMQANFVSGGLLLTVAGNHQIMDATGQGQIIRLFSAVLRGEVLTDEEKRLVNQPREIILPLLGPDYQPGPELADVTVVPLSSDQLQSVSHLPCRWSYFRLTASSLQKLKSEASQQDVVPYISTDDAIGALCWQSVTRARQARLGSGVRTWFARPINVRKWFGLEGYVGHMADVVSIEEMDIDKLSLGTIAGKLRLALQQDDKIRYHAQALATMCHRLSDKSQIIYGAQLDLHRDLLISSWTSMQACEFSYGPLLGVPEASRCPWKETTAPLMLTMPKDRDGGIAIAVCLADDEMDRLKNDDAFAAYVDCIG